MELGAILLHLIFQLIHCYSRSPLLTLQQAADSCKLELSALAHATEALPLPMAAGDAAPASSATATAAAESVDANEQVYSFQVSAPSDLQTGTSLPLNPLPSPLHAQWTSCSSPSPSFSSSSSSFSFEGLLHLSDSLHKPPSHPTSNTVTSSAASTLTLLVSASALYSSISHAVYSTAISCCIEPFFHFLS
jgi:hypothetical protein